MMKLELERIKKHNANLASGGTGLEKNSDVRHTIEESLQEFAKEVLETRRGEKLTNGGHKLAPNNISFDEALKYYYGTGFDGFLKNMQIFKGSDSIKDIAGRFGCANLNKSTMENLMIEHSTFSNPMGTPDINSEFRFIIPEIFTQAIRTGYEHQAMHNNWIRSVQNLSQEEITMPYIERGDGMPSKVNEGADIPVGSIKFGKKKANVFKIGTGFSITDELLMASSLDLLMIFLEEVGNDMSIGADALAFNVLTNGEQADLSESAPVIGVNTAATFAYEDIKRVFTRMRRLGLDPSRVISGEEDGIDITGLSQFQGFSGQTQLSSIRSIIGVPDRFDIDTYTLPTDQIMYLAPEKAMVKLSYRGFMTERQRNPQNQTEELFISDWTNFAIVKRDARVIQDKSLLFSGNGFPTYMDIDSRINESYKSI